MYRPWVHGYLSPHKEKQKAREAVKRRGGKETNVRKKGNLNSDSGTHSTVRKSFNCWLLSPIAKIIQSKNKIQKFQFEKTKYYFTSLDNFFPNEKKIMVLEVLVSSFECTLLLQRGEVQSPVPSPHVYRLTTTCNSTPEQLVPSSGLHRDLHSCDRYTDR